MSICSLENCTGCMACMNVCPKSCITAVENDIGHIFPEIDAGKCVDCGLCKKVCPSINKLQKNVPSNAYAAINKDAKEYLESSSGGAAAVLSKYIIENGGIVYGCTGAMGYDISHIRVDNVKDLWKLRGSKYVESRIGDVYDPIKKDLQNGKTVLFIGTPCQTAAMRSFFKDNEKLYLVDLICHGVPPQKLLKEHLKTIEKTCPDEISFRDGTDYVLKIIKDKNTIKKKKSLFDLYFTGFNKSLYLRESCYNCIYSEKNRVSDITIGDFWGVGKLGFRCADGISVILTNTEKGKRLFKMCSELLTYEEREVSEAVKGNTNLNRPSVKHKNCDKFRKLYPRLGFKKAANRCLVVNRIKYLVLAVYQSIGRK